MKMDRQLFLRRLDELIEVEQGTLTGGESLNNVSEFDSITLMGLIAMVDEYYNVNLSPADLSACKTISDLMDSIERKI